MAGFISDVIYLVITTIGQQISNKKKKQQQTCLKCNLILKQVVSIRTSLYS